MDRINTIMMQNKGELISQPQSHEISHNAIKCKYPTISDFCKVFNPDLQSQAIKHQARAFFGGAPTLEDLEHAYGEAAPLMWIKAQIYELGEFAGVKDKMDIRQIEQTARLICAEERYRHWRVTDIMIFFALVKRQELGEFYGNIDPMKLLGMLKKYQSVRCEMQCRAIAAGRERAKVEEERKAISYEEWQRMKKEQNQN